MPIKILVNGAFGRMGQLAAKAIGTYPGFELVGQTGREYDLLKSIKDSHAQVVVDFTHSKSVFNNLTTIIEAGAHPVIGTTGLTRDQVLLPTIHQATETMPLSQEQQALPQAY